MSKMTKWQKELGAGRRRGRACSKNAWRAPRSTCLPPRVNACECSTEKEEQIEKLGGFCQTAKKKKLLYTEDRLQVAREEIEHLRAWTPKGVNLDNLDTSFEAQVNTTDDAQLNSAACAGDHKYSRRLGEKAAHSEGAAFIVTVRPKDLPECWGGRFPDINLPGYNIDLQAIKEELNQNGKSIEGEFLNWETDKESNWGAR